MQAALYFNRMTVKLVRGEESRRGLIAQEMLRTNELDRSPLARVPSSARPPP